jgi:hypothetical protein
MEAPPAMHTIPPIRTPFTPISLEKVTRKGAPILPKLEKASDIPVPVDLMEVGKD